MPLCLTSSSSPSRVELCDCSNKNFFCFSRCVRLRKPNRSREKKQRSWEQLQRQGGHRSSMTQSSVTIQISTESVPTLPSWFAEVAAFAQVFSHTGIGSPIIE